MKDILRHGLSKLFQILFFVGHIYCIENRNGGVWKNLGTVNLSTALVMVCKNRNQKTEIHRFENFGHLIR